MFWCISTRRGSFLGARSLTHLSITRYSSTKKAFRILDGAITPTCGRMGNQSRGALFLTLWLVMLCAGYDVNQPPNVPFAYESSLLIQRHRYALYKHNNIFSSSGVYLTILVCFSFFLLLHLCWLLLFKQQKWCTATARWFGLVLYMRLTLSPHVETQQRSALLRLQAPSFILDPLLVETHL